MDNPDLQKCFERLRGGDVSAFAEVYHAIKVPVFTVVYRIVQTRDTAEDVTQDVFVKLFSSPPDPSVKNLRGWIFQMAHNQAIDALRKKRDVPLGSHLPPAEASLCETVGLRLDVEKAMAALTCVQREVVSLHIYGELAFREIAPIVGLSLPAAYRCYRRAIKSLRDQLNGGAVE